MRVPQIQRHRRFSPSGRRAAPCDALRSRGFTLFEVMIVVIIVAILAAIAFPAYQSYIRKAHRTPAKTTLLDLAAREERFFSANNVYSPDLVTSLGYGITPVPLPDANSTYYLLSVAVAPDGSSYVATATAQNDQVNDACGNFAVASSGLKTTSNPAVASDCWR